MDPGKGACFGSLRRGAQPSSTPAKAWPAKSWSKPEVACEEDPVPSREKDRPSNRSLQRTPDAVSRYNGLRVGVASRSLGGLGRGAR